jgi:hypothetical protein
MAAGNNNGSDVIIKSLAMGKGAASAKNAMDVQRVSAFSYDYDVAISASTRGDRSGLAYALFQQRRSIRAGPKGIGPTQLRMLCVHPAGQPSEACSIGTAVVEWVRRRVGKEAFVWNVLRLHNCELADKRALEKAETFFLDE